MAHACPSAAFTMRCVWLIAVGDRRQAEATMSRKKGRLIPKKGTPPPVPAANGERLEKRTKTGMECGQMAVGMRSVRSRRTQKETHQVGGTRIRVSHSQTLKCISRSFFRQRQATAPVRQVVCARVRARIPSENVNVTFIRMGGSSWLRLRLRVCGRGP